MVTASYVISICWFGSACTEIFVLPEKLVKFRVRSAEANTSGVRADVSKRSVFEFVEICQKYSLKISRNLSKYFPKPDVIIRRRDSIVLLFLQ